MRIGIITTYFCPFAGGAENNTYYLAKELSKNHEVHIFTSDRKNSHIIKKKEEKIGNINIHRSKTLFRYRYYFAFYPKLVTNLLKYNLDIIHVHSLGFVWHDVCMLIKKLLSLKTKFIITPHGPFMTLKNYPVWQKIIRKIVTSWIKITNKIYNKVIQVNPYQYSWLIKEYKFNKNKISYVPNGVDNSVFQKSNASEFIKKYNLKNKFVISYIGRLMEYKGVQDVLKALPNIIKNKDNIIFIIIGQDAGYYKELKNLASKLGIEKNIRFILDADDKEKFEALEVSEIFVLPSEWEAFGIVLLEAMAKENAIISTKTEGGKFLIKERNGLLYDFNDTKTLENNLRTLMANSKLRRLMQKNNLQKAKEFTWDKIALDLEKIYKEIT